MALFGLSKKKEEASMPPPPFSDSATNLPPDQLGAFQQPGTPDDLMGQPQQQGGYPASQPYQSYNTMGQADMQQGGNPMDYGQYPDPQDMGSQGQPMEQGALMKKLRKLQKPLLKKNGMSLSRMSTRLLNGKTRLSPGLHNWSRG